MKKLFSWLLIPMLSLGILLPCTVSVAQFGQMNYVDGVGVVGTDDAESTDDSLIDILKNAINWILGMLGLLALCLVLYAGFLMVTAGSDEAKVKKGVTIMKNAGIGLVVIALAWMIVSLVFWLIGWIAGDVPATTTWFIPQLFTYLA